MRVAFRHQTSGERQLKYGSTPDGKIPGQIVVKINKLDELRTLIEAQKQSSDTAYSHGVGNNDFHFRIAAGSRSTRLQKAALPHSVLADPAMPFPYLDERADGLT